MDYDSIKRLLHERWRPRIKRAKGREYVLLRRGSREKEWSLGRKKPELWAFLEANRPHATRENERKDKKKEKPKVRSDIHGKEWVDEWTKRRAKPTKKREPKVEKPALDESSLVNMMSMIRSIVTDVMRDELSGIVRNIIDEERNALMATGASGSGMEKRLLQVTDDILIEKKVKFKPQVFEYYRHTLARKGLANQGGQLDFDEWFNEALEEHFVECLGIENVIVIRSPKAS